MHLDIEQGRIKILKHDNEQLKRLHVGMVGSRLVWSGAVLTALMLSPFAPRPVLSHDGATRHPCLLCLPPPLRSPLASPALT